MKLLRDFTMFILGFVIMIFPRIEKELLRSRGYGFEPGTEKEVQYAFSLLPAKDKKIVALDIGANYGDYSALLLDLSPGTQVHAFEPSPQVYEKLKSRFSSRSNVEVHQFGFSNVRGKALLYSDDLEGTMSSLAKRNLSHLDLEFNSSLEIMVRTLEDWFEEFQIVPDLMKIDVEGFEYHVLEGAKELLSKVKVVQFEFGGTNIDSRVFFHDLWEIFSEADFDLYRLTPRGLVHLKGYSEYLEIFVYSNFYAKNRRF